VTASPASSASSEPSKPTERGDELDRIEHLITELVRMAPAADSAIVGELVEHLRRVGAPFAQLARSIAEVVDRVAARQVDPGIALPPLAMACATLIDGMRGALTQRELEAARYEIDTLLPLPPSALRAPAITAPDVPLTSLRVRRP
jgi:hypothetical protein